MLFSASLSLSPPLLLSGGSCKLSKIDYSESLLEAQLEEGKRLIGSKNVILLPLSFHLF